MARDLTVTFDIQNQILSFVAYILNWTCTLFTLLAEKKSLHKVCMDHNYTHSLKGFYFLLQNKNAPYLQLRNLHEIAPFD